MDDINTKHDPHNSPDPDDNPRVAYEHGDADVFTVSKYAIALAFGVLIAASAMWGLFSWFSSQQTLEQTKLPDSVLETRKHMAPPEPRLQSTPKFDLREFRAAEDEVLNHYHWLDASKATARIPIEDAIDIVARKGLPSKPFKGGEGVDEEGFRLLPEQSSSGRTSERIAQ
ncbi:MAG: hypothetical protein M3Z09_14630 [Acidobacteriota bacterium]|nr:hypothetical protein [Acidobacteriota bacterium]